MKRLGWALMLERVCFGCRWEGEGLGALIFLSFGSRGGGERVPDAVLIP